MRWTTPALSDRRSHRGQGASSPRPGRLDAGVLRGAVLVLSVARCAPSPCPRSTATEPVPSATPPPSPPDDCLETNRPGALHLLWVFGDSAEGRPGQEIMFRLDPRWYRANGAEEPRIGERYVIFDYKGWLGVGEVASRCACRLGAWPCPVADGGPDGSPGEVMWNPGSMDWGCSLRWVARAPRVAAMMNGPMMAFFQAEALGPTLERWDKLRVTIFGAQPCPKGEFYVEKGVGKICMDGHDDTFPHTPPPAGWHMAQVIDVDADGSADVEIRVREDCFGSTNRLNVAEVRVREDQGWIPVQRWATPIY